MNKNVYTMVYIDSNSGQIKYTSFVTTEDNPWKHIWDEFSENDYKDAMVFRGTPMQVMH